jgi:hypothetical protein
MTVKNNGESSLGLVETPKIHRQQRWEFSYTFGEN